jgi:hypothetical protein
MRAKKSPGNSRDTMGGERGARIEKGHAIFFHPDYTVGTGVSPVQFGDTPEVAGFTAGWEW